jgi:uncharacterized RDD family membrane protein YckC
MRQLETSTVHFMTEDSNWAPPSAPEPSNQAKPSEPFMSYIPDFVPGYVVPVGNGRRLAAALLDGFLMLFTLFIGWIIWSVILYSKSTSPAKKILGMQIVDSKTGAPASMQQMLLREVLGKMILGPVSRGVTGLISAVMILVTPNRQGIHDYIAKTTVVSTR